MHTDETVLMTSYDPVSYPAGNANEDQQRLVLIDNYRSIIREGMIHEPLSYQLNGEFGRGQQGIVFKGYRRGARDCITLRAIKLFDPGIYSSGARYWADMGRIANQICRLQRVNSPHLVGRDSYEETKGIGYTKMEVIDGINVHDLLYGAHRKTVRSRCTDEEWARYNTVIFRNDNGVRSIQPGVVLYIMRKALRGLEVLHQSGFLHGDIKPANLMINRLGIVKIIDFGRAVRIDEKTTLLLGTPLYMPPEVHRHERGLVQSDLYSLGLVGLELLRGKPLTAADGDMGRDLPTIKERLADDLPNLLPAHVRQNKEFVKMMQQFLHPDPAKRFSCAVEAESMQEGLAVLHQQLTRMGIDSQYDRDLQSYLRHLCPALSRECNYDWVRA